MALLAAAVMVAGCGSGNGAGSGSGVDSGSAPPTNERFTTEADAICATGLQQMRDAVRAAFGSQAPTEAEVTTFTTSETVPMLTAQIDDLKALTPPGGDEATVAAIWDAMDEGLGTIEGDPASVLSDPAPMSDALALARSYGFRSCGNVS